MERILIDHLIHLIDVETKAQQSEMPEPSSRTGSFFLGTFSPTLSSKEPKMPCNVPVCFQGSVLFKWTCFLT